MTFTQRLKGFKRWVSTATVFVFFISNVMAPVPASWAFSAEANLSQGIVQFRIPAGIGRITDLKIHPQSQQVLIHIPNAHRHYEAQIHIDALLKQLNEQVGIRSLYLEGAWSRLDPKPFRFFPKDKMLNHEVLDALVEAGELTGPEVYLIENPAAKGWGIEDYESYKENGEVFRELILNQQHVRRDLKRMLDLWREKSSRHFSKNLRKLIDQKLKFEKQNLGLEAWANFLSDQALRHLHLNFGDVFNQSAWPYLIRYFRLKKIQKEADPEKIRREKADFLTALTRLDIDKILLEKVRILFSGKSGSLENELSEMIPGVSFEEASRYSAARIAFEKLWGTLPRDFDFSPYPNLKNDIQQKILMDELKAEGLMEELRILEDQIADQLAKTQEEKEWLIAFRQYFLLEKLLKVELNREEYQNHFSKKAAGEFAKFFELTQPDPDLEKEVRVHTRKALRFYGLAVQREKTFREKISNHMTANEDKTAVVVTGGFHTDAVKAFALEHEMSYLEITPTITDIRKEQKEVYLAAVLGSRPAKKSAYEAALRLQPEWYKHLGLPGEEAYRRELRIIRNVIPDVSAGNLVPLRQALSPESTAIRLELRHNDGTIGIKLEIKSLMQMGNYQIYSITNAKEIGRRLKKIKADIKIFELRDALLDSAQLVTDKSRQPLAIVLNDRRHRVAIFINLNGAESREKDAAAAEFESRGLNHPYRFVWAHYPAQLVTVENKEYGSITMTGRVSLRPELRGVPPQGFEGLWDRLIRRTNLLTWVFPLKAQPIKVLREKFEDEMRLGYVAFALIKPEAVGKADEIIKQLQQAGFEVYPAKPMQLNGAQAAAFYRLIRKIYGDTEELEDEDAEKIRKIVNGQSIPLFLRHATTHAGDVLKSVITESEKESGILRDVEGVFSPAEVARQSAVISDFNLKAKDAKLLDLEDWISIAASEKLSKPARIEAIQAVSNWDAPAAISSLIQFAQMDGVEFWNVATTLLKKYGNHALTALIRNFEEAKLSLTETVSFLERVSSRANDYALDFIFVQLNDETTSIDEKIRMLNAIEVIGFLKEKHWNKARAFAERIALNGHFGLTLEEQDDLLSILSDILRFNTTPGNIQFLIRFYRENLAETRKSLLCQTLAFIGTPAIMPLLEFARNRSGIEDDRFVLNVLGYMRIVEPARFIKSHGALKNFILEALSEKKLKIDALRVAVEFGLREAIPGVIGLLNSKDRKERSLGREFFLRSAETIGGTAAEGLIAAQYQGRLTENHIFRYIRQMGEAAGENPELTSYLLSRIFSDSSAGNTAESFENAADLLAEVGVRTPAQLQVIILSYLQELEKNYSRQREQRVEMLMRTLIEIRLRRFLTGPQMLLAINLVIDQNPASKNAVLNLLNRLGLDDQGRELIYGVFEGGGAKGVAYAGVLETLEEKGIWFKGVAGTSAGAITAALIAVGYTAEEAKAIILETDFNQFKDLRFKWLHPAIALMAFSGAYKGNTFKKWMEEKLKAKFNGRVPLLKDLEAIPLTVVATDISVDGEKENSILIFDKTNTPDLSVAEAVRMSMSIPLFFEVSRWFGPYPKLDFSKAHRIVDGGTFSNFPIYVFDEARSKGEPILGFVLQEDADKKITFKGAVSWMVKMGLRIDAIHIVYKLLLGGFAISNRLHINPQIWENHIIRVPVGKVGTTDFDMDEETRKWLIQNGRDAVNEKAPLRLARQFEASRELLRRKYGEAVTGRGDSTRILSRRFLDRSVPKKSGVRSELRADRNAAIETPLFGGDIAVRTHLVIEGNRPVFRTQVIFRNGMSEQNPMVAVVVSAQSQSLKTVHQRVVTRLESLALRGRSDIIQTLQSIPGLELRSELREAISVNSGKNREMNDGYSQVLESITFDVETPEGAVPVTLEIAPKQRNWLTGEWREKKFRYNLFVNGSETGSFAEVSLYRDDDGEVMFGNVQMDGDHDFNANAHVSPGIRTALALWLEDYSDRPWILETFRSELRAELAASVRVEGLKETPLSVTSSSLQKSLSLTLRPMDFETGDLVIAYSKNGQVVRAILIDAAEKPNGGHVGGVFLAEPQFIDWNLETSEGELINPNTLSYPVSILYNHGQYPSVEIKISEAALKNEAEYDKIILMGVAKKFGEKYRRIADAGKMLVMTDVDKNAIQLKALRAELRSEVIEAENPVSLRLGSFADYLQVTGTTETGVKRVVQIMDGMLPVSVSGAVGSEEALRALLQNLGFVSRDTTIQNSFDDARNYLGVDEKTTDALVLGPKLAFEMGLLPAIRAVYPNMPVFVVIESEAQIQKILNFNEELKSRNELPVEMIEDVDSAQAQIQSKLRDQVKGASIKATALLSIADSALLAEKLSRELSEVKSMTRQMAQAFVSRTNAIIESLVERFRTEMAVGVAA